MQKIAPHLWFDKEAKEATGFYTSLFENSKITSLTTLHNTPSGDCDVVSFELARQPFMAISAGPLFKFNPSISFHVKCKTTAEVDTLWAKLSERGKVLMELGRYPWSERFGWVQDKYGLSWQVISSGGAVTAQTITPLLMFVGSVCGKAEEAVKFYASIFHDAKVGQIIRRGKGEGPDKEGTVTYAGFTLEGQEFGAMDSAREHGFSFNEAISLMVRCDTQDEIDYYWSKLTEGGDPRAQQCGWLRDKYGVSWQVSPVILGEMLQGKDPVRAARVTEAFLKMKKFEIAELKRAYEGS
jgi:predicted 3-demethylubiquinone-9 3-methyltransferase (glyoxalase superfamily)